MKRFLSLYILLYPYIILFSSWFFVYILSLSYTQFEGYYVGIFCFSFVFLIFIRIGIIIALVIFGTSYAVKMSLIEASIWNLLNKIFYLFVHICLFLITFIIWYYLFGFPYSIFILILIGWIPPLFNLIFGAISGTYSVIIYNASRNKGVWTKGKVILYSFLTFIVGIDLIIAIIHLYKCCMIEKKQKL